MSKIHRHITRVYYAETDAGGVVYHANYFKFMERARIELLREAGYTDIRLTQETGGTLVMVDAHLQYKAPARLDDELIIETKVTHIGGASLKVGQKVLKRVADNESLLLEGNIALVYVSLADFKPLRIPQELRDALKPYQTKEE